MLQVTQSPQSPVLVRQRFSVLGIASPTYSGMTLTLTVDGQFRTNGPLVNPDGTWQVDFVFQQAGVRRLKIEVNNESTEVPISVVTTLPQSQRVRFVRVPSRTPAGQALTVEGVAEGYADGSALLLRADGSFDLSRPIVRSEKWQTTIAFNQAGKRTLEIISSDGKDRDRAEIDITEVPKPRPPRASFTNPPKQVRVEEQVRLTGNAENYNNGDQLLLRADQKLELARPRVQDSKWEALIGFRQPGSRLIEIIGSEQDKAQFVLEVLPPPTGTFQVLSRTTWTSTPSPADLPTLTPRRITMHHTALAGSPAISATQAQEAARMRVIWNSHINGNGWSDIGYHFIVMPSGRVFEARSERRRGAHDLVNDGLGVAFDGIFSSATISTQQFQSAVALCTLLCRRYGFRDPVTPVPTPTADFGTRNLPLILGHRDRVATECPGSEGGRTVRLSDIRVAVRANL
jgi:N-acetylmuramoyl-L-alanine amidase